MEALKARLKQLEDLLSSSSSIIGSTSMENSGKDVILDKIFTLIDKVPNIDPCKTWILDSGATYHMTPMMDFFTSYNPCPKNRKVQTADGTLLTVLGIGVISLEPIGRLEHVLHVLQLFISLISVQKVASLYLYKIEFDGLNAFLCNKVQRWKTGLAEVCQGLYYLSTHRRPPEIVSGAGDYVLPKCNALTAADINRKDELMLIHRRLGHPSFQIIRCMFPEKYKKIRVDHLVCEVCEKAKHKRHSHSSTNIERRKNPFELIHCDVWGRAHLTDLHGFSWLLIFVDDFNRFTWINLLRYKS